MDPIVWKSYLDLAGANREVASLKNLESTGCQTREELRWIKAYYENGNKGVMNTWEVCTTQQHGTVLMTNEK